MALVCEVTLNETTLAIYNLHIESRRSEPLRYRQMCEVLEDARRYGPNVPMLIAGDFNFDVSQLTASAAIEDAGLLNPFASERIGSTKQNRTLGRAHSIDWILIGASLVSKSPCVHVSARGSDHYPISLTFSFGS